MIDPKPEPQGPRCPSCNCGHLPVLWTRRRGKRIVRRRACRHCGRKVTTTEKITPSA